MGQVGLYPGLSVRAVRAPGRKDKHGHDTHDWNEPRGSAGNRSGVGAHGRVMDLYEACATPWKTHAMMSAYVLVGSNGAPLARQPRLTKGSLAWLATKGYSLRFDHLILDFDNPGKATGGGRWTPELVELWEEHLRGSRWLQGALTYPTLHGGRAAIELTEPITDPARFEHAQHAWLMALGREGLAADPACLDWTRFFAPARLMRDDGVVVGEHWRADLAFEHVRPWPPADLPPYRAAVPRPRMGRTRAGASTPPADAGDAWEDLPVVFADRCPPLWRPRAATLAEAIAAVATEWHTLFLALAGALCERDVPVEIVPAIVGAVSDATGADTRRDDRVGGAVTTVERWLARRAGADAAPIRGYDAMLLAWPGVADAVDEALPGGAPERLERQCNRPAPELPPREEVQMRIADSIVAAVRGTTVVVTGCGGGKTKIAIQSAAAAAIPTAGADRAPPGSKTAIALPTNEKAVEVYDDLVRLGAPVARIYSPLAHREGDAWSCVHRAAGIELARGGQSVRRELCDGRGVAPCEVRARCPAYTGVEGPARARVLVGSHALLDELATHAGPEGRLVIDESPAPLIAERFTAGELARVAEYRFAFEPAYVDACAAAIAALRSALETGEAYAAAPFADLVAQHDAAIERSVLERACDGAGLPCAPDDAAGQALRAAGLANRDGPAVPPLRAQAALRARAPGQEPFAAAIGCASRALRAVHRAAAAALNGTPAHAARVERSKDGGAVLVITSPNEPLVRALRRDGATVVLDATPDVEVLSALAGVDLATNERVVRHHAAAGARVSRTLLYWPDGVRKRLFRRDGVEPTPLRSAVRAVVRWAREAPAAAALGFVTFQRVELVLGYALAGTAPAAASARTEWVERRGLSGTNLDECAAAIRDALGEWLGGRAEDGTTRTLMLAHYGGMRGLNRMATAHALATLGDPWNAMDEAREGAAYLGVRDWQARYERQAREELEQAHGRLRVIWRDENLLALHAGTLLPSDPLWAGAVQFRRLPAHRPKADAAMSADALRAILVACGLSIRAGASRLGIAKSALDRYLRSERAIPVALVGRIESLRSGGGARVPVSPNEEDIFIRPSGDSDGFDDQQSHGKSWTPTEADDWWFGHDDGPPSPEA